MNQIPELMQQVRAYLETGALERVDAVCRKLLELAPDHAEMLYNLGLLHQENRNFDIAIAFYQKALTQAPENADAHFNIGNCCIRLGQPDQAIAHLRTAIRLYPGFAAAYNNLGLLLRSNGALDEAVDSFERAVQLDPEKTSYYNNLGLMYQKMGRLQDSLACFQTAIKRTPDDSVTHYNLANVYRHCGHLQEVVTSLEKAVELDPEFQKAHHNLGEALSGLGRFGESADSYRQAIRLKPDQPESWNGLGNALANQGLTSDAVDCYKRTIQLNPNYAGAHLNLGNAYYEDRQLDLAERYLEQALEQEPGFSDAEFNLGLVHLLKGDLAKGWLGYEQRFAKTDWKNNYPFRLDRPKWDGQPFPGKRLLIHDEQGFGDVLQFVRFIEPMKRLGGEVLFETRAPLINLFQNMPGIDQLVVRADRRRSAADYDLYCPLLSLPGLLGTTLETIPNRVPYIRADAGKADQWAGRMDARAFKIGLVWSGNPTHHRGRIRSATLPDFDAVLQTPGVRFYGFQKGATAGDVVRYTDAGLIENLGNDFADFSDTAAAMAHLDLVISIDTSVAHLAGAMGKPVWVLLAYAADWRWLLDRNDSPWYPTMRLFRQEYKGDWSGIMTAVQQELKELLQRK